MHTLVQQLVVHGSRRHIGEGRAVEYRTHGAALTSAQRPRLRLAVPDRLIRLHRPAVPAIVAGLRPTGRPARRPNRSQHRGQRGDRVVGQSVGSLPLFWLSVASSPNSDESFPWISMTFRARPNSPSR